MDWSLEQQKRRGWKLVDRSSRDRAGPGHPEADEMGEAAEKAEVVVSDLRVTTAAHDTTVAEWDLDREDREMDHREMTGT